MMKGSELQMADITQRFFPITQRGGQPGDSTGKSEKSIKTKAVMITTKVVGLILPANSSDKNIKSSYVTHRCGEIWKKGKNQLLCLLIGRTTHSVTTVISTL